MTKTNVTDAAIRKRRQRLHDRGDHSLCTARCPIAAASLRDLMTPEELHRQGYHHRCMPVDCVPARRLADKQMDLVPSAAEVIAGASAAVAEFEAALPLELADDDPRAGLLDIAHRLADLADAGNREEDLIREIRRALGSLVGQFPMSRDPDPSHTFYANFHTRLASRWLGN